VVQSDDAAGTPAQPAVRASDAERERTATTLREHTAAGRLTPEELSERLDSAYAARTVTELDALLHDLPAEAPPAPPPARSHAREQALHAIGFAVLVNVAANLIWLATGSAGSYWPKYVLVLSVIRLAFRLWATLGPGAAHEEARLGRGGARRIEREELRARLRAERTQRRIDRR
jgi:Domain of unknown function (DUF1707)